MRDQHDVFEVAEETADLTLQVQASGACSSALRSSASFPGTPSPASELHCGSLSPFYRRPLGDPHPAASNLALAVVLLVVIAIQAVFNAWQDYSTGRVLASISGLLPSDVLVQRDGATLSCVAQPSADEA